MDEATPPNANPRSGFHVTSTSSRSAEVTPLTLRQTDSVRLVFKPVLVRNGSDPSASVDGTFCYQRKLRTSGWENIQAIPLNSLHAGEGVKLELKSAEVLKLFRGLQTLYETYQRDGLDSGTHTYLRANEGTILGEVASLLEEGRVDGLLDTFVRWAKQSANTLTEKFSKVSDESLVDFDAAIGVARLSRFIGEAESNLENSSESYWQALLTRQSWVVSQIFAAPMIIVREQAYVGGKSITNAGGSIVDYLFTNSLTQNSLIVELKTPTAELLTTAPYRNGVFGPSKELGGATQQVLHARQTLQEDYLSLVRRADNPEFNIYSTKALVVIGTLPTEPERARSLEIYRNAQRGVEIITFDELLAKGRLLLEVLSS